MTDRAHRTYLGETRRTDWPGNWWVARCYSCSWESPPQAWPGIARDLADRHEQTA